MSPAKMFFQKKNPICDNAKQWRDRDPFARCLAAVEPGSQKWFLSLAKQVTKQQRSSSYKSKNCDRKVIRSKLFILHWVSAEARDQEALEQHQRRPLPWAIATTDNDCQVIVIATATILTIFRLHTGERKRALQEHIRTTITKKESDVYFQFFFSTNNVKQRNSVFLSWMTLVEFSIIRFLSPLKMRSRRHENTPADRV